MLDEQLRAQAAATGMLVEAAESAGRGAACNEDALRQTTVRSPIRRIDITAEDDPSYSTGQSALPAGCSDPRPDAKGNHGGGALASRAGRRRKRRGPSRRQATEESQDGKGNELSFELRFSDDYPRRLPYKKLRDEALRVTNDRVTSAKRAAEQ